MTNEIPMSVVKVSHHSAKHIADRYPYAAYGSNLWMAQINERCPHADLVIAGKLLDHRLDFAKVATITTDKTSTVPVGIYKLREKDIERLDRHEGMSRVYDRYLVTPVTDDGRALRCFTYIKRDGALQPPTDKYYGKLLAGYRDWHFDDRRLRHARARAIEVWAAGAEEREKAATTKIIDDVERVRRRYLAASAGQAWAQGEMWEPEGNVVPLTPRNDVKMKHRDVEWGFRDGQHYFRRKGQRDWYLDVSMPDDIANKVARGVLARGLPGAQAYRMKKDGGK